MSGFLLHPPQTKQTAEQAHKKRQPARRRGVLLVHGFTGTPFEMELLAESLCSQEYVCLGVELAGHGKTTTADRLDRTGVADWIRSVDEGFSELAALVDDIAICGLSMGSLLSLNLVASRAQHPPPIRALVAMATPLWLPPPQPQLIRLANRLLRSPLGSRIPSAIKKKGGPDMADAELRAQNPSLPLLPIRALGEFLDLGTLVRGKLSEIRVPTLIAHGYHDGTIPRGCSDELEKRLRESQCPAVERCDLPSSRHVITLDVDRELLFRRIAQFFSLHLPPIFASA